MELKNKVIVVTGATAGIGLEIVRQSIFLGAKVMLHSSPNSSELAQRLAQDFGGNCATMAADLSHFNRLENIISETVKSFGKIDALVNNAAVFPRNDITTIDQKSYESVFNTNVKAPLFLTKAVIAHFLAHHTKGSIVNIGSVNAYCGQDDLLLYSMSKGALMTMTRNMADYLGTEEIRVNQINVGWTHTHKEDEMQRKNGAQQDWHQNINPIFAPRGSILSPQEVAKHVIFWLSDDSIPVSGSVYEVEQYPIIGRNKINA